MLRDFQTDLLFSKQVARSSEVLTLEAFFRRAKITVPSINADRNGVDYIVTPPGGEPIFIDCKRRMRGCSRYWKNGIPELQLERFSVVPCPREPKGIVGWTLDASKKTDLVLFSFDPSDCDLAFLYSFHLLRLAFLENGQKWKPLYQQPDQDSGRWKSRCMFVPEFLVTDAVIKVSRLRPVALRPPEDPDLHRQGHCSA
jgi:hypothetical protein